MKALLNTKMAEGTLVRDHVLKMIGHLNELEILGAEIDGESQVDIVLMSLPESFKSFRLNYSMNKGSYSLAELLKELQAAEGIIGHAKSVQVAEKGSSSSAKRGKKKRKAPKQNTGSKQKTQKSEDKSKGKCFTCGQKGHWKKDCPKAKARAQTGQSSGMPLALVVETCLLACTTGTWCVDTGATNHVCNSLQGFQETRRLAEGEIYLWMGDTSRVAAVAVGDVTLHFGGDKFLVLKDCLYVPSVRRNLISVSGLTCNG